MKFHCHLLLLASLIGGACCFTEEEADGYQLLDNSFDEVSSESNHRMRRATQSFAGNISYTCDTKDLPQPTAEYPAVLFEGLNYNNCSSNGKYKRVRADTFVKWAANQPGRDRGRIFTWQSLLVLPNTNITFRACCPSGNNFVKSVSDLSNTANLHLSVYHHPDLKGNNGIWYERWLHWVMSFYIRIDNPIDESAIPSCGTCYFGNCGITGKCECASGYSGSTCEIRPTNDTYPTEKKPLVLFKEIDFKGQYTPVNPADFKKFASNLRSERVEDYKSMRVLHNRTVTFSRNIVYTSTYTPGADIDNIAEFMLANTGVANGIWYNYDPSIQVDFHVRVEANPACYNCSTTQGVCYTGSCQCMPGYTGAECDTPV